jgi:molybdopterin synthase sulfur carrier subunit
MKIDLALFGAFREFEPAGRVAFDVPDGADVAQLRGAFDAYASAQWPAYEPKLLAVSAFASESTVLRDRDPVPADGRVAVLPPVSGG